MITGLADVLTRIQEIQSRFPGMAHSSSANGANFAALMASTTGSSNSSSAGDAVVTAASNYLGVPYLFGGTNPASGLDCSALVQRTYSDLGYQLPRVASDQARAGVPVASLADAQPGDLVAFGNPVDHIGIYVGNGKMIDAAHPGTSVRIENIVDSPTAIRRIVPNASQGVSPGFAALAAGLGLSSSSTGTSGLGSQTGASAFSSLFDSASTRYGLPDGLLSAVAKAESNFNPNATSSAGALGMMQIMPGTAKSLGVNPLDPAQAIDGAARMLSSGIKHFGSVQLALAAYNAGSSAVKKYGGIPPYPETQNYVKKVMGYMGETE